MKHRVPEQQTGLANILDFRSCLGADIPELKCGNLACQ